MQEKTIEMIGENVDVSQYRDTELSRVLTKLILWARKYIAIHRIARRAPNIECPILDLRTFSDIMNAALIPPYQVECGKPHISFRSEALYRIPSFVRCDILDHFTSKRNKV